MGFKYFYFFILLFYEVKTAVIQVSCPSYCVCDVVNDYRRATCQNKTIVTVEIGIPPQVELLDLSHNQISELGNDVFSNMQLSDLKLLNLSYNKISQISLDSFEGLDQLKSLDLSYNSIQYFLNQWFFSLRSLRELYLRANNLAQINKQPPINLPNLKILDISDNKIEHIHPMVFTSLPNLEVLDIGDNFLLNLRVEVIRPLANLRLLVTNGNSINCKDRYMSLLRRYIKDNDITYVGPCKRKYSVVTDRNEKFEKMRMEITNAPNYNIKEGQKINEAIQYTKRQDNAENYWVDTEPTPDLKDDELIEDDSDKPSKVPEAPNLDNNPKVQPNQEVEMVITSSTKNVPVLTSVKNSWIIDEQKEAQKRGNPDKMIQYVEVCSNNDTSNARLSNSTNPIEKFANDFFKASPVAFVVVSMAIGALGGAIFGAKGKHKDIGAAVKKVLGLIRKIMPSSKIIPKNLLPGNDGGNDGGGSDPKAKPDNENKRKKRDANYWDDRDEVQDDNAELEKKGKGKEKERKGRNSTRDDKKSLLDDEESQVDSTPAMKKKGFLKNQIESKKHLPFDKDVANWNDYLESKPKTKPIKSEKKCSLSTDEEEQLKSRNREKRNKSFRGRDNSRIDDDQNKSRSYKDEGRSKKAVGLDDESKKKRREVKNTDEEEDITKKNENSRSENEKSLLNEEEPPFDNEVKKQKPVESDDKDDDSTDYDYSIKKRNRSKQVSLDRNSDIDFIDKEEEHYKETNLEKESNKKHASHLDDE